MKALILGDIYQFIGKHRNWFIVYLLLVAASAILEFLFILVTFSLFQLLLSNSPVVNAGFLSNILHSIGLHDLLVSVQTLAIIFSVLALISLLLKLALTRLSTLGISYFGSSVIIKSFEKYIKSESSYHSSTRKKDFVSVFTTNSQILISTILLPCIISLNAIPQILLTLAALLCVSTVATISALFMLSSIYFIIVLKLKKRTKNLSKFLGNANSSLSSLSDEVYDAFKEIIVYDLDKFFHTKFSSLASLQQKAVSTVYFISTSPKFIVEALAFFSLGILVAITTNSQTTASLAYLGTLFLSLQRILPLTQQIYFNYSNIKGHSYVLRRIYAFRSAPTRINAFNSSSYHSVYEEKSAVSALSPLIKLHDISYCINDRTILLDLSLDLNLGDFILLSGPSGSGKSTLLDIISGLALVSSGSIESLLNKKDVVYVPTSPFVFPSDFDFNVTLDRPLPHPNRLSNVLNIVGLSKSSGDALLSARIAKNEIGGLSKGQLQRIILARALYSDPKLLILDESTSGLDLSSESEILERIRLDSPDRCVILCSHNTKIAQLFNRFMFMANGTITFPPSPSEMISRMQSQPNS